MPRYEKKTYRTFRGLWSALMHKKRCLDRKPKKGAYNLTVPKSVNIYIFKSKW